jgi:F0F1-type ATP synthase assembly protein I
MSQQIPPSAPQEDKPQGDPWHAVGYVVSGVVLYGAVGWLLDRWLDTDFLVAIGILTGAGLGIYMTYVRFNRPDQQHQHQQHDAEQQDERDR